MPQSNRRYSCITPEKEPSVPTHTALGRENGPRHSAHPKTSQRVEIVKQDPPRGETHPNHRHNAQTRQLCQSPKYEVCLMKVEPTPAHTHNMPDKASLIPKKLRRAMATNSAPPPQHPRREGAPPQQTPAPANLPRSDPPLSSRSKYGISPQLPSRTLRVLYART